MFISPERLDDPDFIDRANRTYLFGMFAEECGANGDMAREGRVPMARLYVQGVPAVRDLDVLVWNPDEGAPVFGDNPTLVVDRPPKGPDHIGSLHLGMGGHGAVMLVEHGRVRFAIPGIDVDGRFALFDDDRRSLARMDWERTRAAYAYVEGLEAKEVRPGPKPALTDGQLVIIGRIAEREYVPEGTPEPVGGWAALGLVFAWGEEDDGTWTPIHKVGPKPGNLALWERAYAEYRRRRCSVLVPLGLSDTEWLRAVGRMGLTAAVTPPTPTQLEAVKQALKHGHTPVGMKRPEGGWAAIGLAQASRRVAGKGVEHYCMPGKTPAASPFMGRRRFSMPLGGRIARQPYCRLVSSHVTPKLPRLFVRFRRIVPRLDTMRVVMYGYARKRHAKSQLGGIGGGVRPSWHRLAQPCTTVHFSLPQKRVGLEALKRPI